MSAPDTEDDLRRRALAAAEAIYRLTDPPPFDGALKFLLRRRAMEVVARMAGLAHYASPRRRASAGEGLGAAAAAAGELIRFAAGRGLVSGDHARRVAGAYEWIEERSRDGAPDQNGRGRTPAGAQAAGRAASSRGAIMNDRQRRIMDYLNSSGRAQISNIRGLFGDACSGKTLQRDLWQLVRSGLIQRQGGNRWTVYSIGH